MGSGRENLDLHAATLKSAKRVEGVWHLELGDGGTLTTDLLVGADGKGSSVRKAAGITVRERKFDQGALVCDLELGRGLDGESVEFHYPNGPFTLVPAGGNRANLVWIDKLAGRDAAVLVGESAHAFPPIGAQGLNLGLRDVASLNACLKAANPGSYGWADAVARSYGAARRGDLARTGAFVDGLFTSLLSPHLPAQALRSAGLWGLKTFPMLRKHAVSFGMGH